MVGAKTEEVAAKANEHRGAAKARQKRGRQHRDLMVSRLGRETKKKWKKKSKDDS